jgi:hypothetical protein
MLLALPTLLFAATPAWAPPQDELTAQQVLENARLQAKVQGKNLFVHIRTDW